MDPASRSLSACVAVLSLLGAARLSSGDVSSCPCPAIPLLPLTKPPPEECRQINSAFRYSCVDGYVRKAGTSNRIKCELKDGVAQWEAPRLDCIEDPTKPKTKEPTTSPVTKQPEEFLPDASPTIRTSTATASATSPPSDRRNITEGGGGVVEGTPRDPVTHTTVKTSTTETSTFAHRSATNDPTSSPEAHSGPVKAAIISSVLLVIVCALIGIVCLLYRRRSRPGHVAPPPAEEVMLMNAPPGLQSKS